MTKADRLLVEISKPAFYIKTTSLKRALEFFEVTTDGKKGLGIKSSYHNYIKDVRRYPLVMLHDETGWGYEKTYYYKMIYAEETANEN